MVQLCVVLAIDGPWVLLLQGVAVICTSVLCLVLSRPPLYSSQCSSSLRSEICSIYVPTHLPSIYIVLDLLHGCLLVNRLTICGRLPSRLSPCLVTTIHGFLGA